MAILTKFIMDVEVKLILVLAHLEETGYEVDAGLFEQLLSKLEPEREAILKRIRTKAGKGFNPGSTPQVRKLVEALKVKITRKTKTGQISTDSIALQSYAHEHEVFKDIHHFRELGKILDTYCKIPKSLDDDGRLRVEYKQLDSKTGRISSPSVIQTLPKNDKHGIRKGFIAKKGHLIVGADFNQQEIRVLAHCSGDVNLNDALRGGVDVHGLAAVKVFNLPCEPGEVKAKFPAQRDRVKAVQFGLIYGAAAYSLAETLRIEMSEAQTLIDDYFNQFKQVKTFIDRTHVLLMKNGFVDDLFGRRRHFPEVLEKQPNKRNGSRMSEAEWKLVNAVRKAKREAQNFMIQGPSATITKLAMIRCHQHIVAEHPGVRMILTLHDELQFEVPEDLVPHFAQELPSLMCDLELDRFGFELPMKVEIKVGPTWGDLTPWTGA